MFFLLELLSWITLLVSIQPSYPYKELKSEWCKSSVDLQVIQVKEWFSPWSCNQRNWRKETWNNSGFEGIQILAYQILVATTKWATKPHVGGEEICQTSEANLFNCSSACENNSCIWKNWKQCKTVAVLLRKLNIVTIMWTIYWPSLLGQDALILTSCCFCTRKH